MIIRNEKPPIFEEAQKLFNLPADQVTFFTYGNTLFNPSGAEVTPDLIRHEEIHAEQQEHHPTVAKLWWERFLHDAEFRIEQEAEAYGAQYKFIIAQPAYADRNKRARLLWEFAKVLSGPMYGRAIGQAAAQQKIREWADFGKHGEDASSGDSGES